MPATLFALPDTVLDAFSFLFAFLSPQPLLRIEAPAFPFLPSRMKVFLLFSFLFHMQCADTPLGGLRQSASSFCFYSFQEVICFSLLGLSLTPPDTGITHTRPSPRLTETTCFIACQHAEYRCHKYRCQLTVTEMWIVAGALRSPLPSA